MGIWLFSILTSVNKKSDNSDKERRGKEEPCEMSWVLTLRGNTKPNAMEVVIKEYYNT